MLLPYEIINKIQQFNIHPVAEIFKKELGKYDDEIELELPNHFKSGKTYPISGILQNIILGKLKVTATPNILFPYIRRMYRNKFCPKCYHLKNEYPTGLDNISTWFHYIRNDWCYTCASKHKRRLDDVLEIEKERIKQKNGRDLYLRKAHEERQNFRDQRLLLKKLRKNRRRR